MSASVRQELWQKLGAAGLVQGEVPAAADTPAPWYVRVMLGIAGWLGAMFLLGFVGAGLAFVFRSEAAALVVGALCCGAAYMIFRVGKRNDLAAQFGLAVSLAGQVMFAYGLHEGLTGDGPTFFIAIAIFEAVLAAVIANFVHRVWSSLAAALALSYALSGMGLFGVGNAVTAAAVALLWLDEPNWAPRGSMWRPIAYGLVFAFLLPDGSMFGWYLARDPGDMVILPGIFWVRRAAIGAVLVFVVYRLLTRDGGASPTMESAALAAAGLVALTALKAPGVAAALIVLVLGFAGGNRALMGLGVAALLGYLSQFYYSLQATLLVKSIALAATGLLLIGLWAAMRFVVGTGEEARRA